MPDFDGVDEPLGNGESASANTSAAGVSELSMVGAVAELKFVGEDGRAGDSNPDTENTGDPRSLCTLEG